MNDTMFFLKPGTRAEVDPTTPDFILTNTQVVDISDNFLWMERARYLTAEAYAALANPKYGLQVEDIVPVISADAYEQHGRARTLAALTTYPDTGATVIAGLGRVVVGAPSNAESVGHPLDAMAFVEPIRGWPHQHEGIAESEIAEIGRFHIATNCRTPRMRSAGLHIRLTRLVYDACAVVARQERIRKVYAILPQYMIKLVTQAGIRVTEIESRLKSDDPSAAQVFDQFDLYWRHASPRLFECPDAPARH